MCNPTFFIEKTTVKVEEIKTSLVYESRLDFAEDLDLIGKENADFIKGIENTRTV